MKTPPSPAVVPRRTTMTNLALNLIEASRMYADKPAIRLDDYVLTYAALDEASARAARLLRARGVAPGDRGGHHAAQRGGVRRHLLRRAARGRHRGPDESAAAGARGRVLRRRLGRAPAARLAPGGRRGRPGGEGGRRRDRRGRARRVGGDTRRL